MCGAHAPRVELLASSRSSFGFGAVATNRSGVAQATPWKVTVSEPQRSSAKNRLLICVMNATIEVPLDFSNRMIE